MIPTQSTRERRQPDDIRLELFVPNYYQQLNNSNNNNNNKLICDEIVRRFRSWKTKYFQLIRAIEWCLPDQDALDRTVDRVRKYSGERYQEYFELDGSCIECAKELSSSLSSSNDDDSNKNDVLHQNWNEQFTTMMMKSEMKPQQKQESEGKCLRHSSTSTSTSTSFGLALLVVFGSAADPLMISNNNNTTEAASAGPKAPTNSSSAEQQRLELYEKKKKIKVDNIGSSNKKNNNSNNKQSFFKSVDSTSRTLKGFLIKNIKNPELIDIFVRRHLLKLILQMKIKSKMNSSSIVNSSAPLVKAFVPMIYEPVRRCSSVLAIGDTIFIIEPFLYAKDGIFSCLGDLVRGSGSMMIRKIYLVVLGDFRDAILISKREVENFAKNTRAKIDVEWIYNNNPHHQVINFEFSDDQQEQQQLTFTIQHFQHGLSVACLQVSSPSQNGVENFPLISFTGDFLSLDSYIKNLFDGADQKQFLSGVLSTYQQQLEYEASMKQKQTSSSSSNNEKNITAVTNDTLLFPSHGGYSWVTHQLDLSWAGFAYLTNKTVSAATSTTTASSNQNNVPKIVAGSLHQLIWKRNHELITSPVQNSEDSDASAFISFDHYVQNLLDETKISISDEQQEQEEEKQRKFSFFFLNSSDPCRAMFDPSVPLILDTRAPEEYEALRIAGSLSLPFALDEPAKSSKKAELWLSQLVMSFFAENDDGDATTTTTQKQDLILVLPEGRALEVLKRVCCILPLVGRSTNSNNNSSIRLLACVISGKVTNSNINKKNILEILSTKVIRGKSSYFSTASSYEDVASILSSNNNKNSSNQHFVIDCRTPIEFAQGSHLQAANIPLADFRYWLMMMMKNKENSSKLPFTLAKDVKDWMTTKTEGTKFLPSRRELFTNFASFEGNEDDEENFMRGAYIGYHKSEIACFDYLVQNIFGSSNSSSSSSSSTTTTFLIYCAGGYRSRIFMSILEAVLLVIFSNKDDDDKIRVCDVGRGAVELMSQHAELWTVKDRGIVCVS